MKNQAFKVEAFCDSDFDSDLDMKKLIFNFFYDWW